VILLFQKTVSGLFLSALPNIIMVTIVIILLRATYIIFHKQKIVLYKEILMLSFIIYLLFLFNIVTFQDVSWSTSNYIPFKEILRYDFGSKLFIKNILGNMVMFMPFGFFIGYYIRTKKIFIPLILCILTSLTIEFTQVIIGRVFDVDDLLLNCLGGILGFGFFRIADNLQDKAPKFLKKDIFYNLFVLLFIAVIILYLFNLVSVGV
jgi:glycopeptide antibiotics resistance protein